MTAATYTQDQPEYRIVIRPNRSLSWRGTLIFYLVAVLVAAIVATLFAIKGAWLILPFTGLELLALGICLYICAWRNTECEVIHIGEDFVRLEKGKKAPAECIEFQRAWSRVKLKKHRLAWYPSRLTISSMGREVEIGAALIEEERRALAKELQRKLN